MPAQQSAPGPVTSPDRPSVAGLIPLDAAAMDEARRVRLGLGLGLLGVALFALTMPMTRLATGSTLDPQLSPLFVTAGRAALAGLLSVVYLWLAGARRPVRAELLPLGLTAAGTVIGFPLFLALGLREVQAVHASVITGVLPLATAVVAALVLRQRASTGFWACALAGCTLVLAYAWLRGGGGPVRGWVAADGLLLLAVLSAAGGYVYGARLAGAMRAEQVICWVLVLSLPLTLPLALWSWPDAAGAPVRLSAWGGFLYVSLFSMWIGFFAWYRGLALGGTMRVSQVQLVQPFLAMLASVPLLGERLDAMTIGFALAVIATVFVGRRMPVGPPAGVASAALRTG